MNLKLSLAAVSLAAGLLIAAMPGSAADTAGIGKLKDVVASQPSGVTDVLWRRGRCHRGIGGYYKWVRGVGRVQCTAAKNCYTNIFGFKVCDWF